MNNSGRGREGVERREPRWPSSTCCCTPAELHLKIQTHVLRKAMPQHMLTAGRQCTQTQRHPATYATWHTMHRHFTCPLVTSGLNQLKGSSLKGRRQAVQERFWYCTSNPVTKPLRECMWRPERFLGGFRVLALWAFTHWSDPTPFTQTHENISFSFFHCTSAVSLLSLNFWSSKEKLRVLLLFTKTALRLLVLLIKGALRRNPNPWVNKQAGLRGK